MIDKVRPVIGRVGGKSRLAPWIIEHLKRFQWSIFCEPFAGSAAVYFRIVQDGIPDQVRSRGHHFRAVLNDADSRITQLFRTVRDHPELLAYAVAMTPYSREEHRLAQQGIEGIEDEIEQARKTLVDGWQSFKYMPGDSWGVEQNCHDAKTSVGVWHTLPQRILNATDHLKRCYIENDDAVKVIERWATPHTAIYADPPYYDCSHYYKEQFDNDQHAQLAECLHTIEAACVIVSYYPHPEILKLYSEDDWEYHYKDTVASSAGITRNSKTRTRPKRQELLLVRKQQNPEKTTVSLSGQMNLF